MSKDINIQFEDNALEVLKQVDPVHRNSLINLGILLISKTQYFKTITGDISEVLKDVTSLNSLDALEEELESVKTITKVEPAKKATNWDNF